MDISRDSIRTIVSACLLGASAASLLVYGTISLGPMPDIDGDLSAATLQSVKHTYMSIGVTAGVGFGAALVPLVARHLDRKHPSWSWLRWLALIAPALALTALTFGIGWVNTGDPYVTGDGRQLGLFIFGLSCLLAVSVLNEPRPAQPVKRQRDPKLCSGI